MIFGFLRVTDFEENYLDTNWTHIGFIYSKTMFDWCRKGRVNLIQSGFFGRGKSKMKARFEPVTSGFASHCLAH